MKIAFGMIVFNGNYVLKQCLESVYPYANEIVIAEGPVTYWQQKGHRTSFDGTNQIIDNFPDPQKKIKIIHSQYSEKDEQCNAYFNLLKDNNDYIWNLDSDEVFKPQDIDTIIRLLETEKYTSVGFKSCTFYGGFDRIMTGFEEENEFKRIYKIYPGSTWLTHRPPTIKHVVNNIFPDKHLDFNNLRNNYGVKMYHYSYVFPRQVFEKLGYYKTAVSKANCHDDYFNRIYKPWVLGNDNQKKEIENRFNGVHEFIGRSSAFTAQFNGEHPEVIKNSINELKNKFMEQENAFCR
ncbi:MAG: glycosyltransferase [Nanoarchaeota archaeon]